MKSIFGTQGALISRSWKRSMDMLFLQPAIAVPFFCLAVGEMAGGGALFFFIQPPLVRYLEPVVLRFWGPGFLHYPYNLILLIHLFVLFRIVLMSTAGAWCTGMTVHALRQVFRTGQVQLRQTIVPTVKKVMGLLVIGVAMTAAAYFFAAFLRGFWEDILPQGREPTVSGPVWTMVLAAAGVVGDGMVQAVFAFCPALLMFNKANILTVWWHNVRLIFRHPLAVIVLVLTPVCWYIPLAVLRPRLPELMFRFVPEAAFLYVGVSVIVVFFINLLVTVLTTTLYLLLESEPALAGRKVTFPTERVG